MLQCANQFSLSEPQTENNTLSFVVVGNIGCFTFIHSANSSSCLSRFCTAPCSPSPVCFVLIRLFYILLIMLHLLWVKCNDGYIKEFSFLCYCPIYIGWNRCRCWEGSSQSVTLLKCVKPKVGACFEIASRRKYQYLC